MPGTTITARDPAHVKVIEDVQRTRIHVLYAGNMFPKFSTGPRRPAPGKTLGLFGIAGSLHLTLLLLCAVLFPAPTGEAFFSGSERDLERAASLSQAGMEALDEGSPERAYEHFALAQQIYERVGDVSNSAKLLSDMGKIQTDLSQYPAALDHLLSALTLYETVDDAPSQMSVLNRLAIVHLEINEVDMALQRFNEALALAEEAGDTGRVASILGNIGIVYARRGDYEKAIEYYTRSFQLEGPDQDPRKAAIFHNNIGVLYARQSDYAQALDHYLQSVSFLEKVGDLQLLGEGYNNAGEALLLLGRLQEAEDAMQKALAYAESSGEKVTEQDCCTNLTALYEARNDFAQALKYHKRFANLRDEIFSETKAAQIAELQTRYETRQKEDEITQLLYEAELQDVQLEKSLQTRYLLIACVTLLVVIMVILAVGYRRKITTQRQLHEKNVQLDHLTQELRRTDLLRRELVSNVSHDLRSPLAVVNGYIETLLLKNEELTSRQRLDHLKTALAASDRLMRLVSDLFDLSLLEARRGKIEREPFFLNELVQDAAQQFGILAKDKGVDLHLDIDADAPMVEADVALMERVLQNLLGNAVRYTPQGGAIEVSVARDAGGVGVRVTNSGPGISKEDIPHLFDRYYTSKHSEKGSVGSGLGLAIVKKILDLHGIGINVVCSTGEFVSFCFRVPVSAQEARSAS